MRETIYHPLAREEAVEAFDYYRQDYPGREHRFRMRLNEALDLIEGTPERWPLVEGRVRRLRRLKFPYTVFYWFNSETIYILAIGHQSRRPGYWTDRIKT